MRSSFESEDARPFLSFSPLLSVIFNLPFLNSINDHQRRFLEYFGAPVKRGGATSDFEIGPCFCPSSFVKAGALQTKQAEYCKQKLDPSWSRAWPKQQHLRGLISRSFYHNLLARISVEEQHPRRFRRKSI
ncbi:hypothetical protein BJY04DRAFT_48568 [Aspergillus karnatakaensis]|uniref:uncharacterized protein n=1 Tax=Aspergillus karnatakaensis TaxID=1810916 RepID=UPI003CCCB3EB